MLWLLVPVFIVPLVLFLFYLAISSCLGDPLRQRGRGRGGLLRPSYGRTYLNSISSGAWENVEMSRIEREREEEDDSDFASEGEEEGEGGGGGGGGGDRGIMDRW